MTTTRNLANGITLGRLLACLVLFALLTGLRLSSEAGVQSWLAWTAYALFVATAASDWLDGHLARKRGEVTVLGRMADPFVDKVLVCGTLVYVSVALPALVPPWVVVVIVSREFLVSGIRSYMESQGISFAAKRAGKVKMLLQCFAIGGVLLLIALGDPHGKHMPGLYRTTLALIWAAVASTIYSGWIYTRAFYRGLTTPRPDANDPSHAAVPRSSILTEEH